MEQLSQESIRLSSSTGGGTLRGVLLSNPNIAAALPEERERLLEEFKILPTQTVGELELFAQSYVLLADALPVSLLAERSLLGKLYTFWSKQCFAITAQNPMAAQLLRLQSNTFFLFPQTIPDLFRLLAGYNDRDAALPTLVHIMTSLSSKGQRGLLSFLAEVDQTFSLQWFSPDMLTLLANYWLKLYWKGKRKSKASRRLRSSAFRKGLMGQLLQLLGKFKSTFGLPDLFLKNLLDELAYRSQGYSSKPIHEVERLHNNLVDAQKYCYKLYRILKLALKEDPQLKEWYLLRFAMSVVEASNTQSCRRRLREHYGRREEHRDWLEDMVKWVNNYGPARIIRYLPNFCLTRPLHSFMDERAYIAHVLEGKNIRRKEGNPWPLSKKGAHVFHSELPSSVHTFHQGITYAFLWQCGFEEDEALMFYGPLSRRVYRSRLLRNDVEIVQDPDYVQQIAGFFKKYRNRMEETDKVFYMFWLMAFRSENPQFSLKGRTMDTINALIAKRKGRPPKVKWKGLGIPDWETVHQETAYRIVQLKNSWDLALEGEMMSHCVGGYTQRCIGGSTSIWSLRKVLPNGNTKRLVTISLSHPGLYISEAKGKGNSSPDELYKSLIKQWHAELLEVLGKE